MLNCCPDEEKADKNQPNCQPSVCFVLPDVTNGGVQEHEVERIEEQDLQVKVHGRVLRKHHSQENEARHAVGQHDREIPCPRYLLALVVGKTDQ